MYLKNNYEYITCITCWKVNPIKWKAQCIECTPFIIIEKQPFICEWCKERTYHKHKFFKE